MSREFPPEVMMEWSGSTAEGAKVTYYCPTNQSFDGSSSTTVGTTCQANGTWLPEIGNLACFPVTSCNKSHIPITGDQQLLMTNYSKTTTVQVGSTVVLSYGVYADTFVCLGDGSYELVETECK
jgi:hypothetical protein